MTDTYVEEDTQSQQLSRIDAPLDRRRIGDMAIDQFAGLKIEEYRQAIEFSKLICQARNGIPPYLRNNGGDCLVVVTQALRWKLEPVWVMQHSYVAKAESLIAYDAAVHAAIVLASGKLLGRPRYEYSGEGEMRRCKVYATFKGESERLDYDTPPLHQCRPPKNQDGIIKGSPLWSKDPDQQLGYYAIRNWGRRHMPEVLGGVYDRDEFEEITQDEVEAKPASPNLLERLPARVEGTKGFQENIVDQGLKREAVLTEQLRQSVAAENARREAAGEPAGAVADDGGSEVAPQAKKPASEAPPKTAEEYMAYAAKWIEVLADPDELEARWASQKELRAEISLPLAIRKRLEGMLATRVAELRKPPKKR